MPEREPQGRREREISKMNLVSSHKVHIGGDTQRDSKCVFRNQEVSSLCMTLSSLKSMGLRDLESKKSFYWGTIKSPSKLKDDCWLLWALALVASFTGQESRPACQLIPSTLGFQSYREV